MILAPHSSSFIWLGKLFNNCLFLKPEFQAPGSNSRGSACQVWPLTPTRQIKSQQGEGQSKEAYYLVGTVTGTKHFSSSLRVQIWALGLNRKRIRAEGERYYSPSVAVAWQGWSFSQLSWEGLCRLVIMVSSLEESNLVRIRESLLPGGWPVLWSPAVPFLGTVSSTCPYKDVLPGF
jgi:hypothetical protein